jgi:hypothetical protein
MIGTKQAAAILGLRPGALTKAVWDDRIPPPVKGPGGAFVWTDADLRRAAWALLGRDLDDVGRGREATNDRA